MTSETDKELLLRVAHGLESGCGANLWLTDPEMRTISRVLREAAGGWNFDVGAIPRDDTVLVSVVPTERNNSKKRDPFVIPAYIDEDGRFCDSGTWKPDPSLHGEYWRTIAWRRFPLPPPPSPEATNSLEPRNDDR